MYSSSACVFDKLMLASLSTLCLWDCSRELFVACLFGVLFLK